MKKVEVYIALRASFIPLGISLLVTNIGRTGDKVPFWLIGGLCIFIGFFWVFEAYQLAIEKEKKDAERQLRIDGILERLDARSQNVFESERLNSIRSEEQQIK